MRLMNKKYFVILFFFALSIRLATLNNIGRTWDESEYITQGYKMIQALKKGKLDDSIFYATYDHPPLLKYLYGLVSNLDIKEITKNGEPIFHYDITYSRLLSVIMGCLAVVLVGIIGQELFSLLVGIVSGVIMATLPFFLGLSQLVTTESFTVFFFTFTIYSFIKLLKKYSLKKVIIVGILTGITIQVKQSNSLLFPMFFLMYGVWYWQKKEKILKIIYTKQFKSIFLIGVISIIVFLLLWPKVLFHLPEIIPIHQKLWGVHTSPPEIFFGRLMLTPLIYFPIMFGVTTPALILALFFIGLLKIDRAKKWVGYCIVLWFFIPFLQSFYPWRQHGVRYIIEIYAPLSLIAAIGFETFVYRFTKNIKLIGVFFLFFLLYMGNILFKLSPYYLDYFNEIVGGINTVYAKRLFQIGWWGQGAREASFYLEKHAPAGATVGIAVSPLHSVPQFISLKASEYQEGKKYDYVIVNDFHVLREQFDDSQIKRNYKPIYIVKADQAHVVTVYKKKEINMFIQPNLINNFFFLNQEFEGIFINLKGIGEFFVCFFLAVVFIFIFYCIGENLRCKLFIIKIDKSFHPFISIALGYIVIGLSIALFGMTSFLYPFVIFSYIFILFLGSIVWTFKNEKMKKNIFQSLRLKEIKNYTWYIGSVAVFVLINFLRLIPAETDVDALWYHTDLPRKYISAHSTMVPVNYQFHLIPIPQLSEMYYVISEMMNFSLLSRFIHFSFYFLIVVLIISYFRPKLKLGFLAALLFVTTPVVIRHASSGLSDFQWVYCWLVFFTCLTRSKLEIQTTKIAGILYGGVLATKIWTLGFFPFVIGYIALLYRKDKSSLLKQLSIFIFITVSIPAIWYVRAYMLTGNPIYPALAHDEEFYPHVPTLANYISRQAILFRISSLYNMSPLLLLGFFGFFSSKARKELFSFQKLYFFFIIMSAAYTVNLYYFGHYLYGWYIPAVLVSAIGFNELIRYKGAKLLVIILFFALFMYYFLNTLVVLPYGFSWADENNYLTRFIARNNSSYYDYGHRFQNHFTQNEHIAAYGLWGFYYANFRPQFVVDIFRKNGSYIASIEKRGLKKILIKGGDIVWFCQNLKIKDCNQYNFKLLTAYEFVYAPASQYLYTFNKK